MKKGSIVLYHSRTNLVVNGKTIAVPAQHLEVVRFERKSAYVFCRHIGSESDGVRVRKDYLTPVKKKDLK